MLFWIFFLKNLLGHPEAFEGLRDAAIDADHMNDGADLLLGCAIRDSAAAMASSRHQKLLLSALWVS